MRVLVTGGAGYIGAHAVARLQQRGDFVVVVDDLSTGLESRIRGVPLINMNLAAEDSALRLSRILLQNQIDAVIHFAGKKRVDESILKPDWYFEQNVGSLQNVLDAMVQAEVGYIVFSSSAAVYGESIGKVDESSLTLPMNPYGYTKLEGEKLISQYVDKFSLVSASLRYFNVAGSDTPELADTQITNLIPIVVNKLRNNQPPEIFGNDYPTADGTCVRDFVHVADLADAHLSVLDNLDRNIGNRVFNIGTGQGYSVNQVVSLARELMRKESIVPKILPRRDGDPAEVVAEIGLIKQKTGWEAQKGLDEILISTIAGNDKF